MLPVAVCVLFSRERRGACRYLPPLIREQLFTERESSGAVQLSQISTERLLAELVALELERRKDAGSYPGGFTPVTHFFGYQARCSLPSNFDCTLGYALGVTAASLVRHGATGYAAVVRNLSAPAEDWEALGVPLPAMMAMRYNKVTSGMPAVPSSPLDTGCGAYLAYKAHAAEWATDDMYVNPGPIQFHGPTADSPPVTVVRDRGDYLDRLAALQDHLQKVAKLCRPGVSEHVLDAAVVGMESLTRILRLVASKDE